MTFGVGNKRHYQSKQPKFRKDPWWSENSDGKNENDTNTETSSGKVLFGKKIEITK